MKKIITLLALLFGLSLGQAHIGYAASSTGANFTVTSRADQSLAPGYVKYEMSSGEEKTFNIVVNNTGEQEATYQLQVINAGMTDSGSIAYSPDQKLANLFQANATDLITPKKQNITVPGKQAVSVPYTIKVSNDGFQGDVLGGIYVQRTSDEGEGKAGLGVKNQFAMAIPVHLISKEKHNLTPVLALNNSKLDQQQKQATVKTSLTNKTARLFGEITMNTVVVDKDGKTVASSEIKDAQMAPGGIMTYATPVKAKSLAPGAYTTKLTLQSGKKTYHLTDTFTIKKTAIDKVATDTNLEPKSTNWIIWLVAGLVAVVIALVIALIVITKRKGGRTA